MSVQVWNIYLNAELGPAWAGGVKGVFVRCVYLEYDIFPRGLVNERLHVMSHVCSEADNDVGNREIVDPVYVPATTRTVT